MIVYEHSDGDWDLCTCAGDPIRAWKITPDGPLEIDATTKINQPSVGPWFRNFSIWRFCISPDHTRIIISRLDGPRAGGGGVYKIEYRNDCVELVNPTYKRWP